jgi:hypothetical protein
MSYRLSKETLEHLAAMRWFKLQYPKEERWSFHIANERKCSESYGRLLKNMGVKKGISDLFIPEPRGEYHGLWIEIKAKDGKKSTEQINFTNDMLSKGYFACFCFGSDEVINTIKWYLKLGQFTTCSLKE